MLSSAPITPPAQQRFLHHDTITMDDLAILDQLASGPLPPRLPKFRRREAPFDPLIFAAAVSSGPHITRHHFHHDFFPTDDYHPHEVGSYDSCDWNAEEAAAASAEHSAGAQRYISHQKPRHERLKELGRSSGGDVKGDLSTQRSQDEQLPSCLATPAPKKRRPSLLPSHDPEPLQNILKNLDNANVLGPAQQPPSNANDVTGLTACNVPARPTLIVQCRARTRIPTPHGPVFLHLYHNNWDVKEHLAIVADQAQLEGPSTSRLIAPAIRSRSLDAAWHEGETEMERIIRGAYAGRLSSTSSVASSANAESIGTGDFDFIPAPLVRIHSECFTGETIGSMRCDCGEQLDEAIRLICQPQTIRAPPSDADSDADPITMPGRGAVVYLRQEGRGIGLLEKIRAYNLQDLGHDTVSANLLLGHGADERGYEIAAAIMRDLGLGAGGEMEERKGVRLLTNNPEKMEALEREGIRVVERVSMVPRSWRCGNEHRRRRRGGAKKAKRSKRLADGHDAEEEDSDADSDSSHASFVEQQLRRGGATLIGAGAAHGPELDRYLRTKVQRMRHMIDLPPSPATAASSASEAASTPATAVSTPGGAVHNAHAKELAYKMGLVSQDESDEDDDEDEDGDTRARRSRSVRSLIASTPDLESDRESVGSSRRERRLPTAELRAYV